MSTKQTPDAVPAKPLTPTEEEILRTISTYRYMSALDVAYSLFSPNSLSYVRHLLSVLCGGKDYQDRNFLYRFPVPTAKAGNRERVYTLGAAGRALVEEFGIPVEWYYRPAKTGRVSGSHLLHQLLVVRFVVAACWWVSRQPEYSLAEVLLSCHRKTDGKKSQEQKQIPPTMVPDAWLHFERQVGGAKSPILLNWIVAQNFRNALKTMCVPVLSLSKARTTGSALSHTGGSHRVRNHRPGRGLRGTRRQSMAAWTREVLKERNMASWAGIFRFTAVAYETLYKDAQALFTKPVWYRPTRRPRCHCLSRRPLLRRSLVSPEFLPASWGKSLAPSLPRAVKGKPAALARP